MQNLKNIFHKISYLQYPFMLGAMYFYYFFLKYDDWTQLNYALILFGIALSFATLQDTTKVSLKFEKKIWKNPKKGRNFLIYMIVMVFIFFTFGIFAFFFAENPTIKEVAVGLIVMGISFIGLVKTGGEIFENHREDKNLQEKFEEK